MSVIHWVKQAARPLSNAPESADIPEVTQLDELDTVVYAKKTRVAKLAG